MQDALDSAQPDDVIWVADGVYRPDEDELNPTGTGNREATFQLQSDVQVFGGFFGDEDPATFDPDDRDFVNNESLLSGDLSENDGPIGAGREGRRNN